MDLTIVDAIIPITSLIAVGIAVHSERPENKRWSPVVGIIGQPFWIYASYTAQTWGIFFLSVVYMFVWASGIKKYWWDK